MYVPPPILLLIAIALSYLISTLFPGFSYNASWFPLAGLVSIASGAWMFSWAVGLLSRHNTTLAPRGKPTKLVTSGPYAITRNPIYLGFLLIAVGTALLFANVLAFVGPVIFFAFVSMFVIPFEEQMLMRSFGKKYTSYLGRIRRWI